MVRCISSHTSKTTVCWLLVLLSFQVAQSQNEKSFAIHTDQDLFYVLDNSKNEDRNYTQGTAFSYSSDRLYKRWVFAPFRLLDKIRGDSVPRTPVMSSVSISGTAFTPLKIDSADAIVGDRPFSFLLGFSTHQVYRVSAQPGPGSVYEAITINYAVLGTDIGYKFQSFAHTHLITGRPKDPKGWNTQLSDGGRFTFLVNYERLKTFRVAGTRTVPGIGLDGFATVGGSIGYYDRAYTGLYLRFGKIDPFSLPTWAFWGNSLATANMNSAQNTLGSTRHCEFFMFSKASLTLMPRNALLIGQRWNRSDEYTLDPSWPVLEVLDIDFGLAFSYNWTKDPEGDAQKKSVRLMFRNTLRSPEFSSGLFPERWHYFGSAGIQFPL